MDAQLAAVATLVAHTRSWRAHKTGRPGFRALSAFRYSRDVFIDSPVGLVIPGRENYQPRSVRRWLDYFPRVRARDLRIGVVGGSIRDAQLADRAQMATFSPFAFTAVDLRGRGTAWVAERVPTVGKAREQGLWAIRFRRVEDVALPPARSVQEATQALAAAMTAAHEFAAGERELRQWQPFFEEALDVLSGTTPHSGDILPARGYREDALRLTAAARTAWVLGDIMSWTDHHPKSAEAKAVHRALTAELYACLIEAVIASVNEGLAS